MKKQYWIFTFGCGQEHAGKCVKIAGSFDEARAKMMERFGKEWCWQYSEQDWEKMRKDPNRRWVMEELMAVIE